MKKRTWAMMAAVAAGAALGLGLPPGAGLRAQTAPAASTAKAPSGEMTPAAQKQVVQQYCVSCHNDEALTGGVSFQHFDAKHLDPSIAGVMVGKLKAHAMPPAGMPQPDDTTRQALIAALSAEAVG